MEAIETEQASPAKVWASWDNPVATPERWNEVKRAVEAGMSQKEASEVFQLSYDAIKKRASREEWITEKRIQAVKEAKIASSVSNQSLVPSNALHAVAETFESHRSGTLLNLAKLAGKGIQRAIDANLQVENWQDAKIAADIAMKLHNVGQDSVQVNVLVGGDGGFDGPLVETGAIDYCDDDENDAE